MAFTAASTTCRPSLLLAPRSSSSSLRPQALLSSRRPTAAFHGLRAPEAPLRRRAASSTGIVCGKVTKGSVPPNFTLKDQDGKTVSLSKFKGKPVVLYFYPADETPGCTKQIACLGEKTYMALGASSPPPLGSSSSPLPPTTRHGIQADDLISSPNHTPPQQESLTATEPDGSGRTCALPTWALIGGVTAGVAMALALSAGAGPAMALGPEGPLLEEFWDNMRRYALYALTVSTGFAWALVQPIWELLRSPVTAVLIVVVIVGGGILVSQVINAMAGNSDFIYMYEQ